MIQQNTLEAVYPLAELLANKGIRVSPIGTTPLEHLMNAGHLELPTKGVGETMMSAEERILKGSVSKDAFGACHHDMAMDEMVEVISATVTRNIDMARNVVNPMIKEVVEDTTELMAAAERIHQTRISVTPLFHHSIWNSPTLAEMVGKYSETPLREVKFYLGVPAELDQASLLELAKTGASRFDEEVESLFEKLGEQRVVDIYQAVFSDAANVRMHSLDEMIRGHSGPSDHVLLIHLFARKLIQEVPEGVPAGLQEYRAYMADILSQSGRAVVSMMRRRELDRQRRHLVSVWPYGRERLGEVQIDIVVNGDVYTQWLNEGGSPEVIMGAYVSDQARGYTELLEGKEKYLSAWKSQERVLATTQRFNRFNNAVQAVQEAVGKQIAQMEDDDLIVQKGLLYRRLKDEVQFLRGRFYEDLYCSMRVLICKVIFPHTDALRILTAIDAVSEENPGIEVREAALLATIEIVATWVAKLCRVEAVTVKA